MDPVSGGNSVSNNPRMNLLQGGSGINDTQSESAKTEAPMADVEENSQASAYGAAAAPVVAKPSPTIIEEAEAIPEPVAPVPEPRPVTPEVQAMASSPKKTGGVIIGVLVVLLLIAGAGIGGWWLLTQNNQPSAPVPVEISVATPTELTQAGSDGKDIPAKGSTNQTTVKFNFALGTSANTGSVVPEVELRPVGTAFTGEPTNTGQEVSADGSDLSFSVESDTLTQGTYHWQARVKKGEDASDWAIFGEDSSAVSFTVDTAAPVQPTVSSIGGQPVANPTIVTSNTPAFTGKAEANSKITIAVGSGTNLNATADASGNWTVTPTSQIANGQYEVTVVAVDPAGNSSTQAKVALTVNPATAADTAPKPTVSSGQAAAPPAQTPATPTTLAPTGDNTRTVSLVSLFILTLAFVGILLIRRRDAT